MIQSMTGFGKAVARNEHYQVSVEIRSLNSRYLELTNRLPRGYFEQELWVKNAVTTRLQRGKVNLSLSVLPLHPEHSAAQVHIDAELLAAYNTQLEQLRLQLGLTDRVPLASLLQLPNVIQEPELAVPDDEWALAQQAVQQALDSLVASRSSEGAVLMQDLLLRAQLIEQQLLEIAPLEHERIAAVKQRMAANLANSLAEMGQANDDRFQQEIIYYLEKNDITEEQVRLKAHIALYRSTLAEAESQGRKLGFIVQEMGREINTLGAKAYHAGIQAIIVRMKDELEKIKEQLNNIL